MSQRFFLETPLGESATATLQGAEAHHLTKVMRARVGEELIAFDGSGWEFAARITSLGKSEVALEIVERREVNRELLHPLTLAVALPKGDRQKFLVEKHVELGTTRLIPLDTERGVAEATPSALERLRRQVIEASKQCGRNRLLEIASPVTLAEMIALAPSERRILSDPSGLPLGTRVAGPCLVAIGPEGGFTSAEVEVARGAGWEVASLGPRILRIETAALAMAARFSGE